MSERISREQYDDLLEENEALRAKYEYVCESIEEEMGHCEFYQKCLKIVSVVLIAICFGALVFAGKYLTLRTENFDLRTNLDASRTLVVHYETANKKFHDWAVEVCEKDETLCTQAEAFK